MSVSFDEVIGAFLGKIIEFEFIKLSEDDRENIVSSYMKRAITEFHRLSGYDLTVDDTLETISISSKDEDADELSDILSEGMVAQWMKQYLNHQELLQNVLNTADYSTYSPAELLLRVGGAYDRVHAEFVQMARDYSYHHGNLKDLYI